MLDMLQFDFHDDLFESIVVVVDSADYYNFEFEDQWGLDVD